MGPMASQISSITIVYSTVYSGADQRKYQSSASPAFVTGEFPAQMASNAENDSIWWRHHGLRLRQCCWTQHYSIHIYAWYQNHNIFYVSFGTDMTSIDTLHLGRPLLRPFLMAHTEATLARQYHDYVIKWKHFPHYCPFVWGIHRSPVNSPHKGQWCGALMFPLICAWKNGWINNREAGDLRRHHAHCDVSVMYIAQHTKCWHKSKIIVNKWSVTWLEWKIIWRVPL